MQTSTYIVRFSLYGDTGLGKEPQAWVQLQQKLMDCLGLAIGRWEVALEELGPRLAMHHEFLRGQFSLRRYAGVAVFREVLAAPDAAEWFCVSPSTITHSVWAPPSSDHLVRHWGELVCSPRCEGVLVSGILSGFSSKPHVPKESLSGAEQWLTPFAQQPIGRGIDHPWIDPKKWKAWSESNDHPICRRGDPRVWAETMAMARAPEVIQMLMSLGFQVKGFGAERFLRGSLPPTDFAYGWAPGADCDRINVVSPGSGLRPRSLYCSARARTYMLEKGVAKSYDFEPVMILDTPDAGQEVLDAMTSPLPDPPSGDRIVASTVRVPRLSQSTEEAIDKAVIRLRAIPRRGRAVGPLCADEAEARTIILHLGLQMPESYVRLAPHLTTYSYEVSGKDIEFCGVGSLRRFSAEETYIEGGTHVPEGLILFGHEGNGDEFFLATQAPSMPADCPVLHYDHEVCAFDRQWPSFASFVAELSPSRWSLGPE